MVLHVASPYASVIRGETVRLILFPLGACIESVDRTHQERQLYSTEPPSMLGIF